MPQDQVRPWKWAARLAVILLLAAGPAAQAQVGRLVTLDTAKPAAPPVIAQAPYDVSIQRLRVLHSYRLEDVRANPTVTLGEAQLDFRPMLANPRATFNIAERLRAMPQAVELRKQASDISEVAQGLVIHHALTYRILPGQCDQPATRAQLISAGANCFTRGTLDRHLEEYGTPGSARYVADPARRSAAMAAYRQQEAAIDADAGSHIAQLRRMLADPAQRNAIVAQIGAAEAARIGTMSDDDLKGYLINAGVQTISETAFVPRMEAGEFTASATARDITASPAEAAAEQDLLDRGAPDQPLAQFPHLLRIEPRSAFRTLDAGAGPGGDQVTDLDLGTYIYLTGFTLGRDYEWSYEFSITINWCVIGCSSTYSIRPHAGFNYGFGLRFPIQASLKYHNVVHAAGGAETVVTPSFAPINGTADQFASTGLASDQLFDGKELVAQVGADAGVDYNLPVIGSGSPDFSVELDLTGLLPPPYQGGHFLPPAPGGHGIDTPYIFNQVDLLGDLLNFGAFGVQIFPAVNINLHSNALTFQVKDEVSGRQIQVSHSGQAITLATDPAHNNDSRFDFADPTYNLGFTLTPGIDPHMYLDLAVWSVSWDPTIWFPQLSVDLPPHGINFGCHAGTTCAIDFPWPKALVTSGNALEQQLVALGCTRNGSAMVCETVASYGQCEPEVSAHKILGLQSCNPGLLEKELDSADRLLTGGGCQRAQSQALRFEDGNRNAYAYVCPIKKGDRGMLNLCNTVQHNGYGLGCGVLAPAPADRLLKGGGCTGGTPSGTYTCPAGMMGLCQTVANNGGTILGCTLAALDDERRRDAKGPFAAPIDYSTHFG